MTKQEYYDLLFVSALDGTFPSSEDGTCRYHASGGRKCAAGILIPDSVYSYDLECVSINNDKVWDSMTHVDDIPRDDMRRIQLCHDSIAHYGADFARQFLPGLNQQHVFYDVVRLEGVPQCRSIRSQSATV